MIPGVQQNENKFVRFSCLYVISMQLIVTLTLPYPSVSWFLFFYLLKGWCASIKIAVNLSSVFLFLLDFELPDNMQQQSE